MRENELADLLIRMAADRGVEIEPAAEELAAVALPSFVDARAFRTAVVHSLESHLRAQVEERLQSIRRRFDVDAQRQPAPAPRPVASPTVVAPSDEAKRPLAAMDGLAAPADATLSDLAQLASDPAPDNAASEEEEMPTDATMVWTTRHG